MAANKFGCEQIKSGEASRFIAQWWKEASPEERASSKEDARLQRDQNSQRLVELGEQCVDHRSEVHDAGATGHYGIGNRHYPLDEERTATPPCNPQMEQDFYAWESVWSQRVDHAPTIPARSSYAYTKHCTIRECKWKYREVMPTATRMKQALLNKVKQTKRILQVFLAVGIGGIDEDQMLHLGSFMVCHLLKGTDAEMVVLMLRVVSGSISAMPVTLGI